VIAGIEGIVIQTDSIKNRKNPHISF